MAEPAREVTVANFCHYFRPRPDAFQSDKKSKSDEALATLKNLFGDADEASQSDIRPDDQLSDEEKAKRKFESLFKDQT